MFYFFSNFYFFSSFFFFFFFFFFFNDTATTEIYTLSYTTLFRSRADHHARLAPGPAEDHHRVDRDQERECEVLGEHTRVERREQRSRQAGGPGPERKCEQLEPVDGHAHQLRGEGVLAQRPPGAAGARGVQEMQADVDHCEECERDVQVGDVEDPLVRDRERAPEEAQGIDAGDALRPVRHVLAE